MEDIYKCIFKAGSSSEAELLSLVAFAKDADTVRHEYSLMRKEQILKSKIFTLTLILHNFIRQFDSFDDVHYLTVIGELEYIDDFENYKYIESLEIGEMDVAGSYSSVYGIQYAMPKLYGMKVKFSIREDELTESMKDSIHNIYILRK